MKSAGIITYEQKEKLIELAKELYRKRIALCDNTDMEHLNQAADKYNGAIELIANALPLMGDK